MLGTHDLKTCFDRTADSAGATRSREPGSAVRRVVQERGATYADAAGVARAGDDGLHLTRDSQGRLAELVAATLTAALLG
jgi:hypothetical protein